VQSWRPTKSGWRLWFLLTPLGRMRESRWLGLLGMYIHDISNKASIKPRHADEAGRSRWSLRASPDLPIRPTCSHLQDFEKRRLACRFNPSDISLAHSISSNSLTDSLTQAPDQTFGMPDRLPQQLPRIPFTTRHISLDNCTVYHIWLRTDESWRTE
jgi:hypothetical protein